MTTSTTIGMRFEVFVEGQPLTGGRKNSAASPGLKKWQDKLTSELTEPKNRAAVLPPYRVCIDFILAPVPGQEQNRGHEYGADVDNLTRIVLNILKKTVFEGTLDDNAILELHAKKCVSSSGGAGVWITIETVSPQALLDFHPCELQRSRTANPSP